jgi:hemoglobin-like flavoprotein
MTPDQVKLVQESFAKVAPISETAAVLFYDRLFEIAPSVKAMFPADMTEQRRKLMAMLAAVVSGLGNLESILPAASALATRHVSYGAKRNTILSLAPHYFGPWKRDLAMAGRPKSLSHGPRLTARCPAS